MPTAGCHIKRIGLRAGLGEFHQSRQIIAAGVAGALDIGFRSRAELAFHLTLDCISIAWFHHYSLIQNNAMTRLGLHLLLYLFSMIFVKVVDLHASGMLT
jgi:hypothetical protein